MAREQKYAVPCNPPIVLTFGTNFDSIIFSSGVAQTILRVVKSIGFRLEKTAQRQLAVGFLPGQIRL